MNLLKSLGCMSSSRGITMMTELPREWKLIHLREVTSKIGSGITPPGGRDSYLDKGIPLIRSQNVLVGFLSISDVAYISAAQHERMSATKLKPSDVLLNITGASIGRSCVFPSGIGEANVNQHVCIIRPKECLNSYFLSAFLNSNIGQKQINSFQAGGNRQGINFYQIGSFEIPFPPLDEQCQIAEILSTWDEAIDQTTQLIAAKQRRKQALMQRLLTGKVRFPGFVGEWERTTLERICVKFLNGGTPSTSNKSFWNGNIPWITGADIVNQKITSVRSYVTEEGVRNSATNVIEKGNLLVVTRTGVGKLAIAPFDLAISQDLTGVYVNPEKVIPTFLFYYLDFRVALLTRLNQGTSINGITRQALVATEIALPSKEEQEKLISVFEACNTELDLLKQKLTALRQQKQGLIQQLLTGKIRVKA